MIPFPAGDPFRALSLTVRLGAVGAAVTALEELSRPEDRRTGGLLDASIQMLYRPGPRALQVLLPVNAVRLGVRGVNVLRLLAAVALLAGGSVDPVARWATLALASATLLLRFESSVGTHASGALSASTFLACGVGLAIGSSRAQSYALAFVAAESAFAYLVSGVGKLHEAPWRRGRAVTTTLSTGVWGRPRSARLLRDHPGVGLAASWITIAIEVAVPLTFVLPWPYALLPIGAALALHLAIAFEMGLNCFVWSFAATYPALLYCSGWLHHSWL